MNKLQAPGSRLQVTHSDSVCDRTRLVGAPISDPARSGGLFNPRRVGDRRSMDSALVWSLEGLSPKVQLEPGVALKFGPWCFFGVWLLVFGVSSNVFASPAEKSSPAFQLHAEPVPKKPRVTIQTTLGDIEVELDRERAPITVTNFLYYVHEGLYSDGMFHRTVTMANQPNNKVKIEVIQASANPARTNDFRPPIRIERTRDTGLKHRDGTISMARDGPDTAQDEFFICIGDQPELDFGGKRNPDGQGFAAFGKVVKGMDVVRRIHAAPANEQKLTAPVRIPRAVRLN
jgi:peptidyl-prolyl cis-trans isomerase A (cyclophilin A)